MNNDKKIKNYMSDNIIDLEKIINDYSSYILTIIRNMTKDNLSEEDKEEIVSDIFFIVWKNQNKLDTDKKLSSYIAGITRNVAKEYLRKNKKEVNISEYENILCSYDNTNFFNSDAEEIIKIERKLENMKKLDKVIFFDFYYSSKSIKDIAKEQKMTEFSVKQRLYRIRKKIKKEVKKNGKR